MTTSFKVGDFGKPKTILHPGALGVLDWLIFQMEKGAKL